MSSPVPPRRIALRVSNGKAYVWDVDDIAVLREKHRICGVLVGTLPHLSQQNVFLGLPLVLLPEEVVLLLEKELALLVDDASAHLPPSATDTTIYRVSRQADIQAQIAFAESRAEEAARTDGRAMSEEAVRKRREREERREAQRREREEAAARGDSDALAVNVEEEAVEAAPSDGRSTAAQTFAYNVPIPASSTPLAWYDPFAPTVLPSTTTPLIPVPATASHLTLASARAAGIWTYPATEMERARCAVFRDLWEKGYYMGGGIKFGGDWLVYPGDPLRYHSHFVAQTLHPSSSSNEGSLSAMEIVAHGRLGTATKKAHLLCSWKPPSQSPSATDPNTHKPDDQGGEVEYYSVEWAGFG